jgi:DNA-binding beta-propeller fold protein YncE
VDIEQQDGEIVLSANDFLEITSDTFVYPHGLTFIDDQTLAVANRGGGVSILRLPTGELGGGVRAAETLWHFRGGRFRWMRSPGSVAVRHHADGLITLLICNNYSHRVTYVTIDPVRWRTVRKGVLLRKGLSVPDGIVVSHNSQWIAVSSHFTHDVKIFAAADTSPDAEAAGALSGVGYPHGLQFTADDRYLLLADAGAPVVHVYERGDSWSGEHNPVRSVEVVDEETFARGRHNPEEGGPKGIAIDQTGQIVAVTNEEQPLALYSLRSLVEGRTEVAMTQSR